MSKTCPTCGATLHNPTIKPAEASGAATSIRKIRFYKTYPLKKDDGQRNIVQRIGECIYYAENKEDFDGLVALIKATYAYDPAFRWVDYYGRDPSY